MCIWTYANHAMHDLKRQVHTTNAAIPTLNTSAESNKCIIAKKLRPENNF